ncbi:MAG TPA: hypothetical protein PK322_15125 [Opitutaceae bacterium]|nr:hypothetical protein [Opitutaceae bacterium]
MSELIRVTGLTNREFFARHAQAGRVGLVGGGELINRLIARAQRHLDARHDWSMWSHAFVFQGERIDGRQWVIESDLDIHRKHIRLGLQENRVEKYFDDEAYTVAAVIDFGLSAEQVRAVLAHSLDLVANNTRYSLRELFGTLLALKNPTLRSEDNLLARDRSFYCSAFVRHVFAQAGVELAPGVAEKNTTPEDLFRSTREHTQWLLVRRRPTSQVKAAVRRVRARIRLAGF